MKTSAELDLRNQKQVHDLFKQEKPEYVFLAAARVGGINANNTYRADFIYDNLAIQLNVIGASHEYNVKKLLFLGSSCIYPKNSQQPIKEEYMLSGYLEKTNEPYAIAKIAGVNMCESFNIQYGNNFISAMPTNLYGPNDNYDLNNSHVLPALIRKFHEAKINNDPFVEIWGSGKPRREFLHVDDMAEACYYLMLNYDEKTLINIGYGEDISINDLALLIKEIVGYTGELKYNAQKPDGTMVKLLDSSRINKLGWKPLIHFRHGITETYKDFQKRYKDLK